MTTVQLPIMTLQDSVFRSPKRKRGERDLGPRLITTGFHPQPQKTSINWNDTYSPSVKVAGKFQKLGIQSPLDASSLQQATLVKPNGKSELPLQPCHQQPQLETDLSMRDQRSQEFPSQLITPPNSAVFSFEVPSTLSLSHSRSRSCKSPPPSTTVSDQFWHESEITGWSPEDPDEDNYGVNGVGYQKSPAVAYALSQRRRQQIADYRSRESREARQRRGERRRNARSSASPSPAALSSDIKKAGKNPTKVVHFLDG